MAQLLLQRISFTAAVDEAFGSDDAKTALQTVRASVEAKRQAAIRVVRGKLHKADRRQVCAMLTLMKEQLDLTGRLGDLLAADGAKARSVWADTEFRFCH